MFLLCHLFRIDLKIWKNLKNYIFREFYGIWYFWVRNLFFTAPLIFGEFYLWRMIFFEWEICFLPCHSFRIDLKIWKNLKNIFFREFYGIWYFFEWEICFFTVPLISELYLLIWKFEKNFEINIMISVLKFCGFAG